MFRGPLGAPVGEVEADTVAKEAMRYIDPFDEMWIAIETDEDEDGHSLWIRRFAAAPMLQEKDPEWDPVVEARQAADRVASIIPEDDFSPINIAENPMNHSLSLSTPDSEYYCHYWEVVNPARSHRDWNHEYVSCTEDILFKHTPPSVDSRAAAMKLVRQFADCVEEAIATIVKEMVLPQAERSIKRHPTAMDVYYHDGMLLRLAVDTAGGFYGGDSNAMKAATEFHHAALLLAQESPKQFMYVPIVVVMTFNGYRVRATSIPPIARNRLVFGRDASTGLLVPFKAPLVSRLLSGLGQALGVKDHVVDEQQKLSSPLPAEAQVFAGKDHRLYILNFGRLIPPTAPTTRHVGYNALVTPLFRRIRPEILKTCGRPLSSDAFFPGSTAENNGELVTITQWIRDDGIPSVAAILSFLEPCNEPAQETIACSGCQRAVDNEIRFVVCRHANECCSICTQCYINAQKLLYFEHSPEAGLEMLASYVRCGTPQPRHPRGLLIRPSIPAVFHCNSLNMRFLPFVYYRLAESARICTAHYLEVEMIARAAKTILWRKLRGTRDPQEATNQCMAFFTALLQPDGDSAEKFWATELGPAIQAQFDVFSPFDTSNLDIEYVYHRVSDLTGIELTPDSVASLATESPFLQLQGVHPVMKLMHVPQHVAVVGEYKEATRGQMEELLLFWMNIECTLGIPAADPAELASWEPQHPCYTVLA